MNKIILSIIAIAFLAISFQRCSSGAYQANPSSNANGSINPLNPLTSKQFTWTGDGSLLSLTYNGQPWSTDSVLFSYVDTLHTNYIYAWGGGKHLVLYIQYGWKDNLYNMGFKQYNNIGMWSSDSSSFFSPYQSALGNSGELYITSNDSLTFSGKFYFQGIDAQGRIANITNGVFNLLK